MELEIEKSLVISTSHVQPKDMELLKQENFYPYTVHNTEYGAMVYIVKDMLIPVEQSIDFICDGHDLEVLLSFSKDFRRMLRLAQQNDCTWLRLDCDGSIVEGYHLNEWEA